MPGNLSLEARVYGTEMESDEPYTVLDRVTLRIDYHYGNSSTRAARAHPHVSQVQAMTICNPPIQCLNVVFWCSTCTSSIAGDKVHAESGLGLTVGGIDRKIREIEAQHALCGRFDLDS